ncbi:hypothetical protein F2P56_028406 [Juglans regia]|uniref:Protein TRM32-like n=2 Tax=Juglans regia TaxID=51240 RepID=A0A833UKJ0_JUGRE|nr:uncharacterized protein LOC109003023 [Juglans regia]KAF5453509.1 hypothetical protein F2P56_028406 [Juglans regia]
MESSKRTSSVIARLMGLDELPIQQPVQKQQRVLSEYYFQRVASIGVRGKRSSHEHPSFRMSNGEREELNYIFRVLDTLDRHKQHNLSVEEGKASSNSSEEKLGFIRHNFPDAKYISVDKKLQDLAELPDALDITYIKKDPLPKYLQEPYSSFANSFHNQQGVPSYSRSGNVPVLKSSSTSYGININKCRKLGRKALQGNVKLLHKPENGTNRSPHGLGIDDICKLSRSQLESNSEACHSPLKGVILKPNHGEVESDARHFSSYSSCEGSLLGDRWLKEFRSTENGAYVSREAKKKISDQCKTNKKVQKDGLAGRVSTLGELFALADDGTRNVYYKPSKHGLSNQTGPSDQDGDHLSFISTNVSKDGPMINFSRSTFLSATSATGNPRSRTRYEGLQSDWYSSLEKSVNSAQHKSRKQTLHHKDGLEYKNLVSNKKTHSFSCLDLESDDNVEAAMCVVLDEVKVKLEKDLSNQNCMGPLSSSSTVSHSALENNCFVRDTWVMEGEMKNKFDSSNTDECNISLPQALVSNVSSVSMGTNVVADAECKVVGGASENSKEEQFEPIICILDTNSDSSSCASDTLIQQRTLVGFHEEGAVYSRCFHTEPESRLSSEEAYHPSPVSVLELPFEDDLSYDLECLDSIGTDICDISETRSEGPGMIVSSDEDSREGSVGEPQENIGLMGLFRVEESRGYSYLIDVLTEAGFHGGILNMDFGTWHTPECPINLSVFETLEKKFGELASWKRSDRRLLFDQINLGLMEILQPCIGVPIWAKPASKRLYPRPSRNMIEEELWMLLVSQEKEASMDSAAKALQKELGFVDLGDDIDLIGREIESLLIDELVSEVVSMGTF